MMMVPIPGYMPRLRRKLIALVFIAGALVFVSTAGAMYGQMVGQAGMTGTLDNQTVNVNGWIMFSSDESDAVVCVTVTQNGHKASGCSTPIAYGDGQVGWSATLTGSGLKPGAANAHAVSTYKEDGKTKTWNWNVNNFTLVG